MPILLDSNFIVLHIEGEDKKKALAEAEKPGPVKDMPIRAFLRAREPDHPLLVPLIRSVPCPSPRTIASVTEKIIERSRPARQRYLDRIEKAARRALAEARGLGCANLAHGFAACGASDKTMLREGSCANLAIVTAYNDMLSAHQPFERFPEIIREAAREAGATAQVAGGVPAMCDGITQGEAGMELSLFSRDVIALSTAVALSHQMFDAAVYLGVCDKIVPGLVIGALSFRPFAVGLCSGRADDIGPSQ